jgi:hypothetical protein
MNVQIIVHTKTSPSIMSKKAEELAKELYPDPKIEDYDDILVYRADRDNAIMGRANVICTYEQAEKDLALTWETIKEIYLVGQSVIEDEFCGRFDDTKDDDDFYKEVFRRFNSERE